MNEYCIVTDDCGPKRVGQYIDSIINEKLSDGWQPYGNMSTSRHEELKWIWTQPMVKGIEVRMSKTL